MPGLLEWVDKLKEEGYTQANAEARICQELILLAISKTSLNQNVTIKGGVVMRSLTGNVRRATQDLDIDFIRYSLSDESIERFISKINYFDDISISIFGKIEELKQQDYSGKRVHIKIEDKNRNHIISKLDLGVHNHFIIEQEEYCFDVGLTDDKVSLLINSREQMLTEKLRSLLKFGTFSTRYKDIFDMHYLSKNIDKEKLFDCFGIYIYNDPGMKENNLEDISLRIKKTFSDKRFRNHINSTDKNWTDLEIDSVLDDFTDFLKELNHG